MSLFRKRHFFSNSRTHFPSLMAKSENTLSVLIAVDSSSNSEKAFEYYLEKLHKTRNEVLLFHAHEFQSPSGFVVAAGGYSADLWVQQEESENRRIRELNQKYKAKCEAAGMSKFKFVVQRGSPGESITSAAQENHVDLIVIGTRGLGLIRRTILGSVSDYVLHHADIATIVVPRG